MDLSSKIKQAINPNTSPKALEILATDEKWYVRLNVAINPNTPPKALEILATDENWYVRNEVARNPNTPHYIKKYFKIKEHLMTLQ
jgi:HEAT repeat protein